MTKAWWQIRRSRGWMVVMVWGAVGGSVLAGGPVVGFQKRQWPAGQHVLEGRVAAFPLATGTIAGVANGRLLCAVGGWETNSWARHQVLITSGAGVGLLYTVHGNTDSQLQVEPDPVATGVVVVGADFEVLANVEDDFGAQLGAGDGVAAVTGEAVAAEVNTAETDPAWAVWKDAGGSWRDEAGQAAFLPLVPGQEHQLTTSAERAVLIVGRVLWQVSHENIVP